MQFSSRSFIGISNNIFPLKNVLSVSVNKLELDELDELDELEDNNSYKNSPMSPILSSLIKGYISHWIFNELKNSKY